MIQICRIELDFVKLISKIKFVEKTNPAGVSYRIQNYEVRLMFNKLT